MKNGFIKRKFYPINEEHIKLALSLRKKLFLKDIYFICDENNFDEINMLKIALHPYRHLKLSYNFIEGIDLTNYYNCELISNSELKNDSADFENVNKYVRRYIMNHFLFSERIIKNCVNEKRYLHCISVATLAKYMAISNNVNINEAYQAGMLHDIAKRFTPEQLNIYMQLNSNDFEKNQPLPVLHQYVGEKMLKRKYKMSNKRVLMAIKHHCLGDYKSKLAKIIYCADKLDPSRGYDSSELINKCLNDIEFGFGEVVAFTNQYLESKGVK